MGTDVVRIMVVDDDEDLANMLKTGITALYPAASVDVASNGVEAFKKIEKAPPELMIVDIVMPESHGLDLIRRIRETRGAESVKILAISGIPSGKQAIAAGADAFFQKGADIANILKAISEYLPRLRGSSNPSS